MPVVDIVTALSVQCHTIYMFIYRFCQRFIPVSVVCHATVEDIRKKIPCILAPHFYQEDTLWKVYTCMHE